MIDKKKLTSIGFIEPGLNISARIESGNGALKFKSTGNDLLDQFGSCARYREERSWSEVDRDMRLIHSKSPRDTLALLLYFRMIDRKVKLFDGTVTEKVQKGQGLKHESIIRAMWLSINNPKLFWNNIELILSVGSWKDIFQMLSYDLILHGWNKRKLNWNAFTNLILVGLENPETTDLVKMYLPSISSSIHNKTARVQSRHFIAKHIATTIFGKSSRTNFTPFSEYRRLKSSGKANLWQKQISQKLIDYIKFDTIPGRALSKMVSSKFLENQGLTESYLDWIESQDIAKYTGYPFELMTQVKSGIINKKVSTVQRITIDKQFMGLVELASRNVNRKSKLITVVDTSTSMTSEAYGLKNVSSYDVAKSLALFFSYLMEGHFSGCFYEFNSTVELKQWKGELPVDRIQNDNSNAYGSTNIQGVAKSFVEILNTGVELSDFPTGILCVSDGEFDKPGNGVTNVSQFRQTLLLGGFPREFIDEFVFIFWDIPNSFYNKQPKSKFETHGEHGNVFYLSGYNGSAISFIMGDEEKPKKTPKSAEELMSIALNQEMMQKISI